MSNSRVQVAEVVRPGTRLEPDPAWTAEDAQQVESLLRQVITELDYCAVALWQYMTRPQDGVESLDEWQQERERERRHEVALDANGVVLSDEEMRHRVEVDLRRADWAAGTIPREYVSRLAFMHAECFVGHLDMIIKLLRKLSSIALTHKPRLEAIVNALEASVGNGSKDVRDSIQHIDERVLGRAGKKKPIVTQPINSHGIMAPQGGVVVIGNLYGNQLGYTAADGSLKSVEVSSVTLTAAQLAVQRTLDAFTWHGQKHYHPPK